MQARLLKESDPLTHFALRASIIVIIRGILMFEHKSKHQSRGKNFAKSKSSSFFFWFDRSTGAEVLMEEHLGELAIGNSLNTIEGPPFAQSKDCTSILLISSVLCLLVVVDVPSSAGSSPLRARRPTKTNPITLSKTAIVRE